MLNFIIVLLNIFFHFIVGGILLHFFGLLFSYFIINNLYIFFFNFILFIFIFGGIILSFFFTNPILIILSILTSFIFVAFFLFFLGVEIVTFTFIIIYIGALMMLFLSIVMLFDISSIKQKYKPKVLNLVLFIAIYFVFIENIYINISTFSMSPWQNLMFVDFSTLFFFSSITLNSNLVFSTLFLQNSEDFFLLILMFILLFSLITAIRAATLTKYILK